MFYNWDLKQFLSSKELEAKKVKKSEFKRGYDIFDCGSQEQFFFRSMTY